MKIAFYEVQPGDEDFLRPKLSDHGLFFTHDTLSENNAQPEAEILSLRSHSPVKKELIEKFPNLKLIVTRTTGFNHIDLEHAAGKNITVCNIPAYGSETVAEYALALILALSRKLYPSIKQVKESLNFDTDALQGFDLEGKTLGVIGTGKIGQTLIKIISGFEMKVLAFDAYKNEEAAKKLNFTYVSLEELLKNSDVISLHVPLLPQTHHLLNSENMPLIKKGAYLINDARGEVIETGALIKALEDGTLAAAGLDVLENEGDLSDETKKLIAMDTVIVTPHNGFNTVEAHHNVLNTTISDIESFISGNPQNVVKAD